ncbi:YidB family protein [Hydrogenimonas sp. SS33]|uniref:YidB family protein n=1 Tax=Hydrogenimonas leucolamina TaxID=2954236 RepID=UPI00336BE387
MDFNELLRLGASMIQNNSDEATTGLDTEALSGALGKIFGSSGGDFDLAGLVKQFAGGGLGDVVQSWLGEGANAAVDPQSVERVLGSDKIEAFARELGIGTDSARRALADALPEIVDKATPAGSDTLSAVLEQVGGFEGAMKMFGGLFGR